jgi:hypothetical protein
MKGILCLSSGEDASGHQAVKLGREDFLIEIQDTGQFLAVTRDKQLEANSGFFRSKHCVEYLEETLGFRGTQLFG